MTKIRTVQEIIDDIPELGKGETYLATDDAQLTFIVGQQKEHYHNIIRMNTSDRNKAKATIAIFDGVYFYALENIKYILTVCADEIKQLSDEGRKVLDSKLANMLQETSLVFYGTGYPRFNDELGEDSDDTKIIKRIMPLFAYVLTARFTEDNNLFNIEKVLDIILYGDYRFISNRAYPVVKVANQYLTYLYETRQHLASHPKEFLQAGYQEEWKRF